jgi:tetratricopeptide (TPR) repeat protein
MWGDFVSKIIELILLIFLGTIDHSIGYACSIEEFDRGADFDEELMDEADNAGFIGVIELEDLAFFKGFNKARILRVYAGKEQIGEKINVAVSVGGPCGDEEDEADFKVKNKLQLVFTSPKLRYVKPGPNLKGVPSYSISSLYGAGGPEERALPKLLKSRVEDEEFLRLLKEAEVLYKSKNWKAAIEKLKVFRGRGSLDAMRFDLLSRIWAASGNYLKAYSSVSKGIGKLPKTTIRSKTIAAKLDDVEFRLNYNRICFLARLHRSDESFSWLEKFLHLPDLPNNLRQKLEVDPDLESLRRDPRWEKLVRKSAK